MSIVAIRRHFRPLDVAKPLAERAGVYLLLAGDEVVYAGASGDVEVRVRAHVDYGIRGRFDRASWLALPRSVHPHYEGALIRALRPRYNQTAPLARGHDEEILDGLDLGHLSTDGWRESLRRNRERARAEQSDV